MLNFTIINRKVNNMRLEIKNNSQFGNFKVIKELDSKRLPSGQTNRIFKCECVCGNTKNIRIGHLTRNKINSCGCIGGVNGLSTHPLYKVWQSILLRTDAERYDNNYTKKNVKVCNEWRDFKTFYNWAILNGYKQGLQIDRENNLGNYTPNNCRFVTPTVNVNNRENTFRVIYKGKDHPFMMLIRDKGLLDNMGCIRSRIKRGWDVDKAIDTPIRQGNYKRT